MRDKPVTALIVTTINGPNPVLRELARGAKENGMPFVVVGDRKTPSDFHIEGCEFLDIPAQMRSGFASAKACPTDHYARKNTGYLYAIQKGARVIIETDDDNYPLPGFFQRRSRRVKAALLEQPGWVNVYRYFGEGAIWPRGLPLDAIFSELVPFEKLHISEVDCPIQQGLSNQNPDVDAIYRLILPLPFNFREDRRIALGPGAWCPFNAQNTTWWHDAFPLLYLPGYCSFRMTDIWRSMVAQRIARENGWSVLYDEPTVRQDRNDHDLMQDFTEEVPGYIHNRKIARVLDTLELKAGVHHLPDNLVKCYQKLVEIGVINPEERTLLDAWLSDLESLGVG